MTLGETRVRATFNPSASDLVSEIKMRTLELIDLCHKHTSGADGETIRLWSLAMTDYENAGMWAVKAATA
jgi:hypothetical protein